MTIKEYYEEMRKLSLMTDKEKEFLKNICVATSHDFFKDINEFANICTRCAHKETRDNSSFLKRIGEAMAAPLKQSLDYQSISRKLFEPSEVIKPALPIYDKDLPSENDKT